MNDQKAGEKPTPGQKLSEDRGVIMPLVLSFLIAVIAVQGWYLLDTRHQIEDLRADDESAAENLADADKDIVTTARSEPGPVESGQIIATQESGSQDPPAQDESALGSLRL